MSELVAAWGQVVPNDAPLPAPRACRHGFLPADETPKAYAALTICLLIR